MKNNSMKKRFDCYLFEFEPYFKVLRSYYILEMFCFIFCYVTGVLIRIVVHTPSPVDTGFPDIDPHRTGAQSTPYFAPFAGANHPSPPTLCTSRGGRGI